MDTPTVDIPNFPKKKRGRPRKCDYPPPDTNGIGRTLEQRKQAAIARGEKFLERIKKPFYQYCMAIAAGARAKEALVISGVPWPDIQYAMRLSDDLKSLLDDAKRERDMRKLEDLDDEIFHRAVNGYEEPIASGGRVVAKKVVRSDRLIELLYRAAHPDQFVQRVDSNVNISARTVNDLIEQIERGTPPGATKPCVFVGDATTKMIGPPPASQELEPDQEPAEEHKDED